MFTRGIIQNTEDYFKELNQRPDKCIYFYRMNGYNDKCRQFIGEYAKEARKSGVVIEGKIANPTEMQNQKTVQMDLLLLYENLFISPLIC